MKKQFRIISLLLLLCLLLSTTAFADNTEVTDVAEEQENNENTESTEDTGDEKKDETVSFPDVTLSDWYYDAVQYVHINGVMIGIDTGEFAPKTEMTRAMVVTVLARLADADTESITESGFEDVPIDSWHAKYIGWAKQNAIVKGVSATEFHPDETVTREQVCVMLSNFLDYFELSTSNVPRPRFEDEGDISSWATDAVLRLQYAGIVNGNDENFFNPKSSTTRAEFAQIVYNSNLATIIKPHE